MFSQQVPKRVILAIACGAFWTHHSLAQVQVLPVAVTGESTSAGGVWTRFGFPRVNDAGTISLWGQQANSSGGVGVPGTVNYIGRPGNWTLAVVSGDPIVNRPHTWLGSLFNTIEISNNGSLAHGATVDGVELPPNTIGVVRFEGMRQPSLVTHAGAAHLGGGSATLMSPRLGRHSGDLFFASQIGADWSGWRQSGTEAPNRFIYRNQLLPELGPEWRVTGHTQIGLQVGAIQHGVELANGNWISQVVATNSASGETRTALLDDSPAGRVVLLQSGQTPPEFEGGWRVGQVRQFSSAGRYLSAVVTVNDDTQTKQAVYQYVDGKFKLVAQTGDEAPGTSSVFAEIGQRFLWSSSISSNGVVVFGADLLGGTPSVGVDGFWTAKEGQLQPVALRNDPVPGIPGSTLSLLLSAGVNSVGDTFYHASLDGELQREVLLMAPAGGNFQPIIIEGDSFEVGPDEFRTVLSFHTTQLLDTGELLLSVDFTDGSSGVFLARTNTVGLVPEPAGGLIVCVLSLYWNTRRRL